MTKLKEKPDKSKLVVVGQVTKLVKLKNYNVKTKEKPCTITPFAPRMKIITKGTSTFTEIGLKHVLSVGVTTLVVRLAKLPLMSFL